MTDNEKRAHDLTMFYIQEITRLKIATANPSSESKTEIPLDFLTDYIELYPKVLEKINEKF